MCGILGGVGVIEEAVFRKALETLHHRGPDDEGVNRFDINAGPIDSSGTDTHSESIFLGHKRLSIIDLSACGRQPMTAGDLTLIYNGEIYNYIELREELKKLGHEFQTETDTEVVLEAYREWGEDCVHRMNGMWSFVILNATTREMFLSRDRMGVKPLYYFQEDGRFYFASEIKALLALPGVTAVADRAELIRYLIYGAQEHREETMFRGIRRLLPGCNGIFCLSDRRLETKKYYSVVDNFLADRKAGNETPDPCSDLRSTFESAIQLRLRSDVTIGMALSGGLDSNIVVHTVNRINPNIETFSSIYTAREQINENSNIDLTCERLGLEKHYTVPDEDKLLSNLEKLVWFQDEPFDTLSVFAQNSVYELMNNHGVKVSLDGQGADEIFAGYPTYRAIYLRERFPASLAGHLKHYRSELPSDLKIAMLSFTPCLFEQLYYKRRARRVLRSGASFVDCASAKFRHFDDVNLKLAHDCAEHLTVLLRYVDRNSMAWSVESRSPFLDYRLMRSGLRCDSALKVKDGYSKYILRKTFEDRVPDEIAWNKEKLGFPVPQEEWLKSEKLRTVLDEAIKESNLIKELRLAIPEPGDPMYWKMANIGLWERVFGISELA